MAQQLVLPSSSTSHPEKTIETYLTCLEIIDNAASKDSDVVAVLSQLNEYLEVNYQRGNIKNNCPVTQNQALLERTLSVLLGFLDRTQPHFIAESNMNIARKKILDVLNKFPHNKLPKEKLEIVLNKTFDLLKTDNDQVTIISLRVIIEILKQGRAQISRGVSGIPEFLALFKDIYSNIPKNLDKIFEAKHTKLKLDAEEISENDIISYRNEIFTSMSIYLGKKVSGNENDKDNIRTVLPRGRNSLKVLVELPIVVVLIYEQFKENLSNEIVDILSIVVEIAAIQPPQNYKTNKAYSKDVYVDFIGIQAKIFAFIAYIVRIYPDIVKVHAQKIIDSIFNVLQNIPPEVTNFRKEVIIAIRHFVSSAIRTYFTPYIDNLLEPTFILGPGYCCQELLRSHNYSLLADVVNSCRLQIPLDTVTKALMLFGKNLHDETIILPIQNVQCKLVLHLVDCVKQHANKDPTVAAVAQELLMKTLEILVYKFKIIAKIYVPRLNKNSKPAELQQKQNNSSTLTSETVEAEKLGIKLEEKEIPKSKLGQTTYMNAFTVPEVRMIVKTLVMSVKSITQSGFTVQNTRETSVFIKLVKWALLAFDVYAVSCPGINNVPNINLQNQRLPPVRSKEEKEVLEHFAGVFLTMEHHIFREIFSTMIEYFVNRIAANPSLQVVGNSFLTRQDTSPIFATVMVEYLLERLEEIGNGDKERSNLYLKLFKLVFGSVSIYPVENENMLRPHLHQIVNRSMELAMTSKRPYNYFMLLRTLFRSIGGGNHDQLYQEFLPLLPSLLQGLNSLQSGIHRQQMKDLYVELCLTVPVRLSSLLPYLPMLMHPLVSALYGSHILISQGLRTLELCVDNLQPEYLHEHVEPVRAELMQALWRCLHNPQDNIAVNAYRVLGKFGGGNRKMMTEPQKLNYVEDHSPSPSIIVHFMEQGVPIEFSVDKIIDSAIQILRQPGDIVFYKKQCWEIVRSYVFSSISLDFDSSLIHRLLISISVKPQNMAKGLGSRCQDKVARQTHINALCGIIYALNVKDLYQEVQPVFESIMRHYTFLAMAQQTGPFCQNMLNEISEIDPFVMIDAITAIIGSGDKELCSLGKLAIQMSLETAEKVLRTKDIACRLPYFNYMAEKMCSLCYERSWFSKFGGCLAIMYMYELMSIRWIYEHLIFFIKSQLFVLMDSAGEVSSGSIDQAKDNLEKLIKLCAPRIKEDANTDLEAIQTKALTDVTSELVRQVTSPSDLLREQSMYLLRIFAEAQEKSIVEIMEPHKDILADMIPPKKHLLRHQSSNTQIGLMEGNTFCTTLSPRLFTIDVKIQEHNAFFGEVKSICESSDATLSKLTCYKQTPTSPSCLIPTRIAAMRALAACYYIPGSADNIFKTLYQSLERSQPELQEAAFQCMKTFVKGAQIDIAMVHDIMRPLLGTLCDYRNLNLSGARRLSYLVQLFPHSFKEKLCIQLFQHLQKHLENLLQEQKGATKTGETEQLIVIIINIFHQTPAAGSNYIETLTQIILKTEDSLLVSSSSPFREPLLKFLLRYPSETVMFMLSDKIIKDPLWNTFLEYIIKHKDGKPFREILQSVAGVDRLNELTLNATSNFIKFTQEERYECQYQIIRIVSTLIQFDDQWIATQHVLTKTFFEKIWKNDEFHDRHKNIDNVPYKYWNEAKLLLKILLNYFSHQATNRSIQQIDLLFELLRVFSGNFINNFQFFRDFLQITIAQSYTVEWKRCLFFRFTEIFATDLLADYLKARILQNLIIPCFSASFDRGETDKLIRGNLTNQSIEQEDNIIHVCINKLFKPSNDKPLSDPVYIALIQFGCVLVEQASPHLYETNQMKNGTYVYKMLQFIWPVIISSNNACDLMVKSQAHLLASYIISKFPGPPQQIARIICTVFTNLLKAYQPEIRSIIRQSLEILIPAIPTKIPNGLSLLISWTKRIIVEEGHLLYQLYHIIYVIVRHYTFYYKVRHQIIICLVNSLQRLGINSATNAEHRKLSIEICDIIIRWETARVKNMNQETLDAGIKRNHVGEPSQSSVKKQEIRLPDENKPIDKIHVDTVLNFLIRLTCVATENANPAMPGETFARRCFGLVKLALKPEIWGQYATEIRLQWVDKILCSVESANFNISNVSIALEMLTYIISVISPELVLHNIKSFQKGLITCISSNHNRVIRLTHSFLTRLMSTFPTEPPNVTVSSQHPELECIYSTVGKVIFEGLTNYEKNQNASTLSLFSTIMLLKAACTNNPSYVDRLIGPFVRVIQRMSIEYLKSTTTENNTNASDLLILSLDLVKNRVGIMTTETKKSYIGYILVGLIEKTQDAKVMKAIVKMVEDWVKNSKPPNPALIHSPNTILGPSLKEKSILLVKLMQYVEKKFPELNGQFLELINYIYRDETLKQTDLKIKLESAFLAGLRCTQPSIRQKFFEIFDASINRRLIERLLYIVSSQNWETMGTHYWIKQCIELILVTTDDNNYIDLTIGTPILPSIMSVINSAEPRDKEKWLQFDLNCIQLNTVQITETYINEDDDNKDLIIKSINELVEAHKNFISSTQKVKTLTFLQAVSQICHLDTSLAEKVWLDLFPKIWKILTDRQRNALQEELTPFLGSGSHLCQRDIYPSAVATMFEALSNCIPPMHLKPALQVYLGTTHNLWYRVVLNLEKMVAEHSVGSIIKPKKEDCYDFEPDSNNAQVAIRELAEMYSQLREEDMWIGLWQKHSKYKETSVALALEQQGFFEKALNTYENVIGRQRQDHSNTPIPPNLMPECRLWENQWIRCSKELNQWDHLVEYGKNKNVRNTLLVLESAWRLPDWELMKEALLNTESNCPKEYLWKVQLYHGYLAICHTDDQRLTYVEKHVESANTLCIKEWRRLPKIISNIHIPYLHASQQIVELQEAYMIYVCQQERGSNITDIKGLVKTWRNRKPLISDDLSHWSDIFTWRQHHFQFITRSYDTQNESGNIQPNMVGVHASAEAIINFGKIGRKHNLPGVCLDSLSRIYYSIPSVPILDCYQKIRQQVKCYLHMASQSGNKEIQEGLDVIESTNLKYFNKEMTCEIYALKGMLLSQIGRNEEANRAFSAAVQLHDGLSIAWSLWADFVEEQFTKQPEPDIELGISAIICYLYACRNHHSETKARKCLAKIIWLLTYDNEKNSLAETLDKNYNGIQPSLWLPWIPQLLTILMRNEGKCVLNLLSQIGRIYPQAVYLPLRTLYCTAKLLSQKFKCDGTGKQTGSQTKFSEEQPQEMQKATPSMWRCCKVMHGQREAHPTVLSSLEGIVDQMVWFRENWYEEVLKQLRQCLTKCYVLAFENRGAVAEATITTHTLHFVKKIQSTFGLGIENITHSVTSNVSSSASESLARRAEVTIQDPVFKILKGQFTADFDFSQPGAMRLQNLIHKLKKWIKILEAKTKLIPKSSLIEDKCRFLSNFSLQTAELELPGEFLLPKPFNYHVRIARFLPRSEVVQKHNTAARRFFIRGHNGKIYPYLVVWDSGIGDARREERALQLLRLLNYYFSKQKETARRYLRLTVPKVVAASPQMRLVEDNPATISLLDIYKKVCLINNKDENEPITKYYDKLAAVQSQGMQASLQNLKEILRETQLTMVSKSLLKEWALKTYPSPTDYWIFRKRLTLQIALASFCEYVLHFTRQNPDMMFIHQDTGLLNVSYFKFDVDESKGELDSNRPVPFRLTPNLQEFLTETGISGPLVASMTAAARCLVYPNFKFTAILQTILKDEMIFTHQKLMNVQKPEDRQEQYNVTSIANVPGEAVVKMVNHAVNCILQRLNSLANFDDAESKVTTLVAAARNPDNLCRMDPAWHPWL